MSKQTESQPATRMSSLPWLLYQAKNHRDSYLQSVAFAACGVVCQIAPYFVVADILRRLVAGERDLGVYLRLCAVMAGLWVLRVVFHAISTACSHKATFAVLGEMRKNCTDRLARMPLGDVLDQPSGALKSTLVERIDAIETTLAHIVPEFTANLLAPVAILVCLFAADGAWRWRRLLPCRLAWPATWA